MATPPALLRAQQKRGRAVIAEMETGGERGEKPHLLEELSVLSFVDGWQLGANELHVVLVQNPLLQEHINILISRMVEHLDTAAQHSAVAVHSCTFD